MSEFRNFESYQSTDWLEFAALQGLHKYMEGRIEEAVDELVGTVRSAMHVSGGEGTVEDFQLSTDVDPDDDRFGYVLALSPMLSNEGSPSISALYAKVDREQDLLAQPSLLISLSKVGVGSRVSVEKSRPADNDDWQQILKLLHIATLRMTEPRFYETDQKTINILIQEHDGVLAYLASEFGDKEQSAGQNPLAVLEGELGSVFERLGEMASYEGREALGFTQGGSRMVVEKDDSDYLIVLLDDSDPLTYRKFVVGPYAEAKMNHKRHHYTFVDEISDEDVVTAMGLLKSGSFMFGETLEAAVNQINEITIEENKIYRENNSALRNMFDVHD